MLYDKEKNELVGARDHFGIKPLYYTIVNDTVENAVKMAKITVENAEK